MTMRRLPPATSFEDFFSAFSKSVHADVELRDGDIVLSHTGDGLLNPALAHHTTAAPGTVSTAALGSVSRPATRASSPSGKATSSVLPRLSTQASPSPSSPRLQDRATTVPLLPRHLAALVALQASDGSWCFNDTLQFVIGDAAPPPPEGISPKLWATAVVLTIFRQFPEHFQLLEAAYDKAMLHVDDGVLRLAKPLVDVSTAAMDRIRPYQNTEARAIRAQLAREAAAKRAEEDAEAARLEREREQAIYISKYGRWRARQLPMTTQELMRSALATNVETIFPRTERRLHVPGPVKSSEMEIRAGDAVECCWRRVDGSKLPERQRHWWLCLVTTVNADGKTVTIQFLDAPFERERNVRFQYLRLARDDARDRRARAFEKFRQQWEAPVPLDDELQRLEKIDARRKWRAPWTTQSLPLLPVATETSVSAVSSPTDSPRKRLTLTPDVLTRHTARIVVDGMDEQLYQNAIAAALAYDKVYRQLSSVVTAATQRYAAAVLFQERFHAFDAFLDVAVNLVRRTVETLERIDQWATHRGGTCRFVWQGTDFVRTLLTSLDFLSTHRHVREWYGDDFAFSMNPFLMVTSIRDLVHDRGLCFTATLQPLAPENPLRIALRMHKDEIHGTNAMGDAPLETPTWWPQARYDDALVARIHQCEDVVLRYLQSTRCLV